MPDIAAVPAARLVAIRQKRHIVHIDHQKILRPAAPLPDSAQAIRQDPPLQHIKILFAAHLIHEARKRRLRRQAIASVRRNRASR